MGTDQREAEKRREERVTEPKKQREFQFKETKQERRIAQRENNLNGGEMDE